MIQDLQMICLYAFVSDLEGARKFYETKAGFRQVESHARDVYYDAGDILYVLKIAEDFDIKLTPQRRDNSNLIVFHVHDHSRAYKDLQARDIKLSRPLSYEVGTTAVFADEDGHRLALYEPSQASLTWPSGKKIREVLTRSGKDLEERFHGRPMIYLFLFVKDYHLALEFYRDKLGLPVLEEEEAVGVVKYDCGGVMLTTHVEESDPRALPVDENTSKSIAPVLYVPDIRSACETLIQRGVVFHSPIRQGDMGLILDLMDADGHLFYLCEPSAAFRATVAGRKITAIVNKYMQKDEMGSDIAV